MDKTLKLREAKRNKNDEFYTLLEDIEKEICHYRKHLKNKTVYCNADNPFRSNFFKYFVNNFNNLKLKKLVATCYSSDKLLSSKDTLHSHGALKAVVKYVPDGFLVNSETDVENLFKLPGNKLVKLEGDGDFRSNECVKILKKSDIVVTNPPFSLFRDLLDLLKTYDKQFILLGNQNVITFKNLFPRLVNNEVILGVSTHSGPRFFIVPDSYPTVGEMKIKEGKRAIGVPGVRWFTNINHGIVPEFLELNESYSPEKYPEYDNFAGVIEVSVTKQIPKDFDGIMGVPITFLDKYNPKQFEIIGSSKTGVMDFLRTKKYSKDEYKNAGSLNSSSAYPLPNGELKLTYARIFIRRKQ